MHAFARFSVLRAACCALLTTPALATVHTIQVTLNGVEETPPNTSAGIATATVTLDDVALTVDVTGSYSGLGSNATLCHIHGNAPVGQPAGILVNLNVSGGTSGTISSGGAVTAQQAADILSGVTYLNLHTQQIPGGELRGQILVEPTGTTSFCFGDGSLATACPCAAPDTVPSPAAATAHGCANTFNLNGALLKVTGTTSPDTVQFLADIGTGYTGYALMVMSTATNASGVASGDGVLCVGTPTIQFGGHNSGTNEPTGLWMYPNTAQTTSVSTVTSQPAATTSSYQCMYRNAQAGFCGAGTFNVTSGVQVVWP